MGKTKTKLVAFTLTMTGVPSWNGKWSGEGRLYCRIKLINEPQTRWELPTDFRYRWPDNWEANIHMEIVDGNKARRLRKASDGFCGYDWMIDSILRYNEIKVDLLQVACPICSKPLTVRAMETSTWCSACSQTVEVNRNVVEDKAAQAE